MRDIVRQVLQFQIATGEPLAEAPHVPPDWQRRLKADLVLEEFLELMKACGFAVLPNQHTGKLELVEMFEPSIVDATDACIDLAYVQVGMGNAWGLPLVAAWDEVHAANMRKRMPDGSFKRRADGKVLKPEEWVGPNIEKCVNEAKQRYDDRTKSLPFCDACGNMMMDGKSCRTEGCEFKATPLEGA